MEGSGRSRHFGIMSTTMGFCLRIAHQRSRLVGATALCGLAPPRTLRCFSTAPTGPLRGIRVLDLARILAGPSATQMLGDMGADIIKIEKPKSGDDTRRYAPPFLPKNTSEDSETAAYFASCNRNKRSVEVNYTTKEGQEVVRRLLAESDILIENFKTGTLNKYGLGYEQIKDEFPHLIYCSITGFGQTGPYKARPAYDMLIQAMGGSMSLTGVPDGEPMKTGLSLFDLCAGLHGVIGILAALQEKNVTGLGQQVDIGMLDVAVALLANQGMNYLAHKVRQQRVGNNHPNVVPYQVMPTADGHFILTASNDEQFGKFCTVAGRDELMQDERFNTMKARVVNRPHVTPALNEITKTKTTNEWLEKLEKAGVGCAPILHPDEVFADPHVQAREMEIKMRMPGLEQPQSLIGSPMKFSRTQVNYRLPPPALGQHTEEVLLAAKYSQADIAALQAAGAVGSIKVRTEKTREYVEEVSSEPEATPRVGPLRGSTWDNVRSMSVPNAAAYLDDAPKPKKPVVSTGQGVKKKATWEDIKSISVPSADSYVKK